MVLWLVLAGLVCWWRGPAYRQAFVVNYYPYGGTLFQPDFFQEWASARNLFNGLPIYTPHEITLERYLGMRPNTSDPYFIAVNAHPPTSVLLALPFAALNFADAFALWNVLSLLALAVSAGLIVYNHGLPFSIWDLLPAITLLLLCNSFRHQMIQGQLNLVLLLLVTGTWAAERTGRPVWAGVLLAAAAAIKLYPAFLFLYFAMRGRWRALAAGAVAFFVLTALTALILGPQAYTDYFLHVLPRTALWRSNWVNLSLSGVWFKLFDPSKQFPPIELHPLIWNPAVAWMGMVCSAMVLTTLLYRVVPRLRSPQDADLGFSLCILAMFLVSPITWDHYLLLLALPIAVLWQRFPREGMGREVLVFCVFILCWEPWMVMEHVLILLDSDHVRSTGAWLAEPVETLTALSVPCYALIGLFAMAYWLSREDRFVATTATARHAVT
jgi:hypothetical protein